jgi:tetratricopeptide (TPR) repeat protein
MSADWEWNDLNQQAEQEAAAIIERLRSRISVGPNEAIIDDLLDSAVWASQHGDEARAVAALRVAVAIDPSCWKAYYNLGWQYLTIGIRLHQPYMGKVTLYGSASPLATSFDQSLKERTAFYNYALQNLEKVVQIAPSLSKGWFLMGQTLYYMGNYDEARTNLHRAIELDPTGEGGKMAEETLAMLERSLRRSSY